MNTPRAIIGSAFLFCWAILLAGQYVSAAAYSGGVSRTLEAGFERIGWLLPTVAWACLAVAVIIFAASFSGANSKNSPTDAPLP
jgi:hypothetical protein